MNWLDFVIIIIVVVAAVMGMRTGLIGAAISAVAVLVGWQLAGHWADDVGSIFGESVSNDTWVTVISYVIIVGASVVVAGVIGKLIRPILSIATLGLSSMADKLGGLALGLIFGIAIAGALVLAMARFAYNFELPEEGVAGSVVQRIPQVEDKRQGFEDALMGSSIVPVFIDITDAIPGGALGFVPTDFQTAFDLLEESIDKEDAS